jgi:serine/threonine protein kinase
MSRGSVYEIVHTRKEHLSNDLKRRILMDTAKGMAYLHSINIIHR